MITDITPLLGKIHNQESKAFMQTLPGNCIDLTVTSPPYDNLRTYNGFVFDFEGIAKELFRITKVGGVVVWVVGDATVDGSETGTSFKQALFFKECGFNLHDTMIWWRRTLPQCGNRYEPAFEYMFILSKGAPKTFNPILSDLLYHDSRKHKNFHRNSEGDFKDTFFKNNDKVRIGNLWDIPNRGHDDIAYQHPALFPEELANDHIISWSNPGDIVYDCFMGSGTVAKMAERNNRKWLGTEISKEYCEIAQKRIDAERMQLKLF